jgi:hypothetical protein
MKPVEPNLNRIGPVVKNWQLAKPGVSFSFIVP